MIRFEGKRKLLSLLTASSMLLLSAVSIAGLGGAAPASAASPDFELRILHTNDTHAHLDTAPKRVTAAKQARTENTILVDAGDVFSGTLYFNQFNGLADVWFMNLMGYDAMTFGNHEFDKGPGALADFIEAANFPFVSSNIDFSANAEVGGLFKGEIGAASVTGAVYSSIVKEVGGERIGIFGLTTPDTVSLSSPGDTIVFEDYKASAETAVAKLKEAGVDKIVVLSHLGYTEDEKLARQVSGIDVIVGGHSHTKLEEPVVYNADGEPTLIVQTGEYGDNLGQLDVTFDERGVLKAWSGKLLAVDGYEDDAEAAAKLQEFAAPLDELRKTVVGKSEAALDGSRETVRKGETNLGNLIADGMLAKVKSIVQAPDAAGYVTIQNAGGIRASIDEGDITLGEVLTVMPFGNNLTALKMTGREIAAALENGVSGAESGEGRFPQVAGMRFYYDSTRQPEIVDSVTGEVKQEGSRIVKVQIEGADGSYSDIDPNAYYIVATNSFLAGGGDFYRSMAAAKEDGRLYELNLVDYEVFVDYLSRLGTVNSETEGRITDLLGGPLPGQGVVIPLPSNGSNGSGGNGANGEEQTDGGSAPDDGEEGSSGSGEPSGGESPAIEFSDTAGHWAEASIRQAAYLGIVNGYPDGEFRPDAPATRIEFTAMLGRAFKLEGESSSPDFADEIPSWARSYVAQAAAKGIVTGYADKTFRPNGTLTRVEMTVMAVRALGLPTDPAASPGFADDDRIPQWARPYVAAAYEAGLVGGTGGNLFSPNREATRAEAVGLLLAAAVLAGANGN
ncbi:S-layer homology domain-containing protein [Cohnella massiliensis]|uniref:S-layer homology domain-containing protein n=1 Tax=Cohnella massiliensis TaxID=1816691 RepID=UPI0009BB1936|nr:S-layer homology domain-containing protein [Cohnella massiliensis]